MKVLIDVDGLAPHASTSDREALLAALNVKGERIENRYDTLRHLLTGAGYRIITGPIGARYWACVSPEVQIHVLPDDYQYDERVSPVEWGYIQAGCTGTEAKELAKRRTPPTPRHRLYARWVAAITPEPLEPWVHEEYPVEILEVEDGIRLLETAREAGTYLALDWEWHRETQEAVGLAVSDATKNYYVPVRSSEHVAKDGGASLRQAWWDFISRGGRGVLHGGRADLGTQLPGDPCSLGVYRLDDTMVMAYLLGESRLGLKRLTKKYLHREVIENNYEWANQPVRFTARYAAGGDTRNTYDLAMVLRRRLKKAGQWGIYRKFERRLVPIIASMEKYGTPVDIEQVKREYRKQVALEYGMRRAVMENYGRDLADNMDSRRFIVDCGFPDPGTLDQRTITMNPHWCIDLILFYRQARTRRRNFLKHHLLQEFLLRRPELVDKKLRPIKANKRKREALFNAQARINAIGDGLYRVFPRFNQAGTVDSDAKRAPRSGRLSSSDPNLQNQPRDIREIYVPPPGCTWWSYDFTSMELVIAATLSGDSAMHPATMHDDFQQYIKVKTAKDIGHVPAKTGNFEQLYKGGAAQLQRILAKQRAFLTMADCELIVKSHHELFAGYHNWGELVVAFARKYGYSETLAGRRRYIMEFNSHDPVLVKHGERAAINHRVQGTAADLVKEGMLKVQRVLQEYGAHMCTQVHDEINGWIDANADLAGFDKKMRNVLESLHLPVKVGAGSPYGKSWGEAH